MKSTYPIIVVVMTALVLLSGCAGANPSTAAILATNEAAAATSVAQLATNTQAAIVAATGVVLTQNAPPTPTPTPPTPLKPLVVAEYTPAAAARTIEQICADALPATEPETRTFTQAEQVLEEGVDYRAVFCTGAGPVYVDLLEEQTPITVNNFVFLADKGYYNNTTFHRVIDQFMAQGGDPTATGTGDPGYSFEDEFVPDLRFDGPGKLAMANSGPATNGSQFFITTVPTSNLNDRHTIFGQVIEGQANVENIRLRDPDNPVVASTPTNTPSPADATAEATAADATAEATAADATAEATAADVTAEATAADATAEATAADATAEATVESNPPGEALNTVIIITDPTTVQLATKVTAAQDEVVAAMDGIDDLISGELAAMLENTKAVQTTDEAVTAAPEAAREALGKVLADNNHQYRVSSLLNNIACDVNQVQFIGAGYTLDAFASAADASAALADPAWAQIPLDSGFTDQGPSGSVPYPVFSQQITACDQPAVRAMTYWQRGPFIVTLEITLPASSSGSLPALGRVLSDFVGGRIYEPLLTTVLYKDIH